MENNIRLLDHDEIRVSGVVDLFSCDTAIHCSAGIHCPLHFLRTEQLLLFQCNQQLFTRVPNELVLQEDWQTEPVRQGIEGTTCDSHHL